MASPKKAITQDQSIDRFDGQHVEIVRRMVLGSMTLSASGGGGNFLHEAIEIMLRDGKLQDHLADGMTVTDRMEFVALGHTFTLTVEPLADRVSEPDREPEWER